MSSARRPRTTYKEKTMLNLLHVYTSPNHRSSVLRYWPVTHVTLSHLSAHLTHDPWPADPLSAVVQQNGDSSTNSSLEWSIKLSLGLHTAWRRTQDRERWRRTVEALQIVCIHTTCMPATFDLFFPLKAKGPKGHLHCSVVTRQHIPELIDTLTELLTYTANNNRFGVLLM